jgi:hypothetical protein
MAARKIEAFFVTDFLKAFQGCLPLSLNEEMARTIPGKVYFLQFKVRVSGSENSEVTLGPYGSHAPFGGPAVGILPIRRPH